jgi:hypothetical protein
VTKKVAIAVTHDVKWNRQAPVPKGAGIFDYFKLALVDSESGKLIKYQRSPSWETALKNALPPLPDAHSTDSVYLLDWNLKRSYREYVFTFERITDPAAAGAGEGSVRERPAADRGIPVTNPTDPPIAAEANRSQEEQHDDQQHKGPHLYAFNVVVGLQWKATQDYLQMLRRAFRSASDFLFDATNGQMIFGQVIIGGPEVMNCADIRIYKSNRLHPRTWLGGLYDEKYRHPIRMGSGLWNPRLKLAIEWDEPEGYRTLIHEWAHYALRLPDEYLGGGRATSNSTEEEPDHNLTLPMYDPTSDSLMAMPLSFSEFGKGFWYPNGSATPAAASVGSYEILTVWFPEIENYGIVGGPSRFPISLPRLWSPHEKAPGNSVAVSIPKIDSPSYHCWLYVLRNIVDGNFQTLIDHGTIIYKMPDPGAPAGETPPDNGTAPTGSNDTSTEATAEPDASGELDTQPGEDAGTIQDSFPEVQLQSRPRNLPTPTLQNDFRVRVGPDSDLLPRSILRQLEKSPEIIVDDLQEGDRLVLVAQSHGDQMLVYSKDVKEVNNGSATLDKAPWADVTPEGNPVARLAVCPLPGVAGEGDRIEVKVTDTGNSPGLVLFPMDETGSKTIHPDEPTAINTFDGHILMQWNGETAEEEKLLIVPFSQGGVIASHRGVHAPPDTAGASDGSLLVFFSEPQTGSDGTTSNGTVENGGVTAEAANPEEDGVTAEAANPEEDGVTIITTRLHAAQGPQGDDMGPYIYALATSHSLKDATKYKPTLVLYYDRPSKGAGASFGFKPVLCRLNVDKWDAIAESHAPVDRGFVAIPLTGDPKTGTGTAPGFFADPPTPEYYRLKWMAVHPPGK